jgi:site-specific DNA-methyltransferase (adenine-specific)
MRKAKLELTNEDNRELMARYPDNYFDLAIVDPPYGIGANKEKEHNGWKSYGIKEWDNEIPKKKYFDELKRVSKNQIVWGGNYMTEFLPPKMCWLLWDKGQRDFSLADGELAWTSFDKAMRIFTMPRVTAIQDAKNSGGKIHPTQKPVKLYEWLLMNYAKEGDKILDTHLGSMSIAIACHDYGFDLVGCELDKEYYDQGMARVKKHTNQLNLFIE